VKRKLGLTVAILAALAASVAASANDAPASVVVVVGTVHARPDKVAELRALLESQVAPSRADDGCLRYELSESASDPTLFMTVEQWSSQESLNAHLGSDRIQDFLKTVTDEGLIDGTPSLQITNSLM
jgi:quinol monooxygenase YgiN